ncbi:MAG: VCBS repeat-containing protein, partial [bacterium]|nr:VCBS repeat-containing protein [bacterium]
AAGDLDGDGYDEIVSGAGPGAVYGPHVRGFNYDGAGSATPISGVSFFAYGTLKFGVKVACGDIDGDGMDEIITGAGPGVVFGPHVRAWNVDGGTASPIGGVNFFAYDGTLYGANVAAFDVDGDGIDEILTMPGPEPGTPGQVRGWNYDGSGSATMIPALDFGAYSDETLEYTRGGTIAGGTF